MVWELDSSGICISPLLTSLTVNISHHHPFYLILYWMAKFWILYCWGSNSEFWISSYIWCWGSEKVGGTTLSITTLKNLIMKSISICKRRIRDPVVGLSAPCRGKSWTSPLPQPKAKIDVRVNFFIQQMSLQLVCPWSCLSFIYFFFHVFRYRRTFTCFSVFQEAILGQNYCGEDSHSSLSISISSNFSSLIHLSVFSILSIFSSPEHIVF